MCHALGGRGGMIGSSCVISGRWGGIAAQDRSICGCLYVPSGCAACAGHRVADGAAGCGRHQWQRQRRHRRHRHQEFIAFLDHLDATVTRRESGAYAPGDVDAIYDRMILPHYREAKMTTSLMQASASDLDPFPCADLSG